jgi:hypothetical protein
MCIRQAGRLCEFGFLFRDIRARFNNRFKIAL